MTMTTTMITTERLDNGDALPMHLPDLLLNDESSKSTPTLTSGDSNGSRSSSDADTANDKPSLNILNQASNITLNANNISFDPSQIPGANNYIAGSHQQQNSTPSRGGGTAPSLAHNSVQNSTVSSRPHSVLMEHKVAPSQMRPNPSYFQPQRPIQHQQQDQHREQQIHKKTTLMDGRVPATRRDGRKLFVGGLPNTVTDKSFLQFFQHYGEVIDSVVLIDRRTRRSRGFGFVTFSDPNVAASLLTTIRGRTGVVNIMGRNCEVKASEPKTYEAAHVAHSTINLPIRSPHHHGNALFHHRANQHEHQQQITLGAGKEGIPISNYHVGVNEADTTMSREKERMPTYSHSTITRVPPSTVSSDADASSSPAHVLYIQNNFYTLAPGMNLPPSCAMNAKLTPEALVQAQQRELMAVLGETAEESCTSSTMNSCSALRPLHPGLSYSEVTGCIQRGQI